MKPVTSSRLQLKMVGEKGVNGQSTCLLLVFLLISLIPSVASPGWITPDTPDEQLKEAEADLNDCLTDAAKEATTEQGFRYLRSRCNAKFKPRVDAIQKLILNEIFLDIENNR